MESEDLKEWIRKYYTKKYNYDELFRQQCVIKSIKYTYLKQLREVADQFEQRKKEFDESPSG